MKGDTRGITVRAGLIGVLLAAGLPFLAGCPSSALTIAQAAPPPSTESPALRSVVPIPEDNIKEAVARLPDLVKTMMTNTGIPGVAVAVVHDGKIVYAQGFGVRKVGEDAPVTADTVFQLASVSKPMTGTVIAEAIGRCASTGSNCSLSWGTPVQDYLTDFALSDPYVTQHVTIGDLMAHRSGLPFHAGDDLETLGFDRQQIFARLAQLPLHPFRTSYSYTNYGLTAAALAAANAAGLSWPDLAEQALFAPLGMNSTSYRYSDFLSRSNRAAMHVKRDGKWQALYSFATDRAAPASGLSSSVNDMAAWMALVLADGQFDGRQLIAPAALLPALSPQSVAAAPSTPSARGGFYGYGFDLSYGMSGRVMLGHAGAFAQGASTSFELIPSADIGVIVLTNAFPIGAAETITKQFCDIVQYGRLLTDWPLIYTNAFAPFLGPRGDLGGKQPPANPAPPRPDSAYTGTYRSDFFGDATVKTEDGKLILVLGPAQLEYTLIPWNGDEFAIDLTGPEYSPGSLSSVWFDADSSGTASRLSVTIFNNELANNADPADAFSPYLRVSGP